MFALTRKKKYIKKKIYPLYTLQIVKKRESHKLPHVNTHGGERELSGLGVWVGEVIQERNLAMLSEIKYAEPKIQQAPC